MRTVKFLIPMFALALGLGAIANCSDDDDNGAECGNGILEGNEECDGTEFATADDCTTEGFYAGDVTCAADCTIDFSACTNCGDGVKDADEECDATDFGTATCTTEGHTGGDLTCASDCTIDDSQCTDLTCDSVSVTSDASPYAESGEMDGGTELDWYYEEMVDLGDGNEWWLSLELYGDYVSGGITTGAKTLGVAPEDNYSTCAYCVMLYRCVDADCTDTDAFFPTAGTLNLTTVSEATTGNLTGSVTGANWVEVTIDPDNDYESTPVDGGDCYDQTGTYSFDQPVEAY